MELNKYLSITPEIENALKEGKPVVALESTILSHGMPYPENVEFAHKVLIRDLKAGDPVIKYGEEIGYMLVDAPKGTWIHNHNMGCDRGKR